MPIVTTQGLRDTPETASTIPDVAWAIAAGTADIITAVFDPAVVALTDGLIVGVRASAANVTTTPTFNPNSLGAHTIVKQGGVALLQGDIPGPLAEILLRYNLANTRWELLNPQAVASSAETEAPLPYVGTPLLPNLHLSNSTGDATNDVVTSAGRCRDQADTTNLRLAAAITKQLDVAWAAGTAAGGCDTSTKGNSQTWNGWLIGTLALAPIQVARTSNVATLYFAAAHGLAVGTSIMVRDVGSSFDSTLVGDVLTVVTSTTISWANSGSDIPVVALSGSPTVDAYDMLFSQSATAPTMPSDWTAKQCLGAVMSDGSAVLRPFIQNGADFLLKTALLDLNDGAPGTNAKTFTATVPLGVQHLVKLNVQQTQGNALYFSSPDGVDQAPSTSIAPLSSVEASGTAETSGQITVQCSTASLIRYRNSANQPCRVVTLAWNDPRRRYF